MVRLERSAKASFGGGFHGSRANALKCQSRGPPPFLARANELRALFALLREADCSVGPSQSSVAEWDEARELPKDVKTAIQDHCLNYLSPLHRRKSSKAAKLDRFREAIAQLRQRAVSCGIDFDPLQLPGRKHDFLAILEAIDPELPQVTVISNKLFLRTFCPPRLHSLRWPKPSAILGTPSTQSSTQEHARE